MRSHAVDTNRLRMHLVESGPEDGIPVVLIHGNLSTGRFYEHLFADAPERYRLLAPDMRGFGDTEKLPIDATRGLRDWADDTAALLRALGVEQPPHLAGWSTGGAAIAAFALERPVASLTFIDPVSPYGYGATKLDGTPHFPDFAGSGGGTGNPEFTARLAAGDRTRGILNARSPKYTNWAGIADLEPMPPILWTHGAQDIVVADGSPWEMGTLGQLGAVPGWPGAEAFGPQPMVAQIRAVLERCGARIEIFEESGHFPPIDAYERWSALFFGFLESAT
jgi:pimeloyl-ACP methyl ester carboxylesterase